MARWQMAFLDWFWKKPADPAPQPIPVSHLPPVPVTPRPAGPAGAPSEAGIQLTAHQEGCVLTAMKDVDGVYVLGYGNKIFDGKPVVAGQTTDQAGATRNLRVHSQACATAVTSAVKVALTQGQLDALTDFVYNVGIGGLLASTILKNLNSRQPVTEELFTRWNKITKNGQKVELPALTARRKAEYQLYLS